MNDDLFTGEISQGEAAPPPKDGKTARVLKIIGAFVYPAAVGGAFALTVIATDGLDVAVIFPVILLYGLSAAAFMEEFMFLARGRRYAFLNLIQKVTKHPFFVYLIHAVMTLLPFGLLAVSYAIGLSFS
ncbi:MAG: hypothetical protein LBH24_04825 [Clostridiales bacterium]|jgi:hypothetical protein|nr:hypothetical protein [Clostridiales bacterium]